MFLKATTKKDVLIHIGIIMAISLVLILLFFYVYLPVTTNHGEKIKVPDIKGKTIEESETILSKNNLRFQVNDSTYVSGAVPFSVLSQNPVAGSEVKANRKIYITLTAKTPPMVPMPELKDKSLMAAKMELKSRDLILMEPHLVSSPFVNLVIRQYVNGTEIAAKTLIPKGTKVLLDVGNGEDNKEIGLPNLVGQNIDDAKAMIVEQGLKIGMEKREQGSGRNSEEVIRQKPEFRSGALIRVGETVDLWYAE